MTHRLIPLSREKRVNVKTNFEIAKRFLGRITIAAWSLLLAVEEATTRPIANGTVKEKG